MEIFLLILIFILILGSPSYSYKLKEMDDKLEQVRQELRELKRGKE